MRSGRSIMVGLLALASFETCHQFRHQTQHSLCLEKEDEAALLTRSIEN